MKKYILLSLLFSQTAFAFLLIDPAYRLSDPKNTVVNIGSGGCRSNGMSNEELLGSIEESINDYWNTVTESELRLTVGGEVSRIGVLNSIPGEILVYCAALGMSGPSGVTSNNSNGSAVIRLNGTTLTPGNYGPGAVTGTLAHEIGHAIGLHHSGDPASIMTYESHAWTVKPKFLSQDDKDGVAYLYPREGQAGGLIPGCSAIAADSDVPRGFSFGAYMFEILGMILVLALIKFSARLRFRKK